ncbi:MAG: SurA N-terminal domain-containing protein [Patescibacteria group bacterium]
MKRPTLKRAKKEAAPPSRITNETVAEHREQILAGGRKFKYPHQYERHKLVFNVILIAVVTVVVLAVVIWWQLYPAQNTSTFIYRVTRILPVPVATVDGAQVRYSDYLMSLSGSKHYLEQSARLNLNSDDGKRQIEFHKRQALDSAIADAYASKVAREKNIRVSDEQVDKVIDASLTTVSGRISQDIYDDSTLSTLGYSADEYRQLIRHALIRQEVSYAIDNKANTAKDAAEELLKVEPKLALADIAKRLQDKGYAVQLGSTGSLVPKTNHDGGVTQQAAKLKTGETSAFFRSSDGSFESNGYYVVQLVESNDKQVSYNYIRIPLTVLSEQLKTLAKNNKIQEFIEVKESSSEVIRR